MATYDVEIDDDFILIANFAFFVLINFVCGFCLYKYDTN